MNSVYARIGIKVIIIRHVKSPKMRISLQKWGSLLLTRRRSSKTEVPVSRMRIHWAGLLCGSLYWCEVCILQTEWSMGPLDWNELLVSRVGPRFNRWGGVGVLAILLSPPCLDHSLLIDYGSLGQSINQIDRWSPSNIINWAENQHQVAWSHNPIDRNT